MPVNRLRLTATLFIALLLVASLPLASASEDDDPAPGNGEMWAYGTMQNGNGGLSANESKAVGGSGNWDEGSTDLVYESEPLSGTAQLDEDIVHVRLHLERSCLFSPCNSVDVRLLVNDTIVSEAQLTAGGNGVYEADLTITLDEGIIQHNTTIRLEFSWTRAADTTDETLYDGANETGVTFYIDDYLPFVPNPPPIEPEPTENSRRHTSGLIFLPFIIVALGMTFYIFQQPRRSETGLEVEESSVEETIVWDDDSDQLSFTTNWKLRATSLCALYTAQGIPSGFISYTLIAFFAERGYSAAAIGNMLFWVYLPWVFKFLWGPFVDTYHYLPMGRRRPWILTAQTGMILTVFIIVFIPSVEEKIFLLTFLLFIHNLFASLQDVAVDGLAVDILSPEEFGKINGFMFGAKRFGTMIGGAGIGVLIGSWGIRGGIFLMVPMLAMIMCLPLFFRERPGEKLLPWTEGEAVIKSSNSGNSKETGKMKDPGYVRGELSNENLIKALLIDFALLIFIFLFLKLTIGDIEVPILGEVPPHWSVWLIVLASWGYFFYWAPVEEWDSFGMQFFSLSRERSDIVKALSLKAPLIGILLAMLTYFWEFLIPVLNVLFIQQLGWTDTEYVKITGGLAVTTAIGGTLLGGIIADWFGARRVASLFAVLTGLSIFTIALAEPLWNNKAVMTFLIVLYPFLGAAMGISLISLFMNVTWPRVGATQFTLYMALLNFGALFGLKMAGYFEENFDYTTTIMIGGCCQLMIAFVLPFIDPGQTRRELGNEF